MEDNSTPSPHDRNHLTLDAYNQCANTYLERTSRPVEGWVKTFIDSALEYVPRGASVLEIGSGPGKHADYLEHHGLVVERSEASIGLLSRLQSKGISVRKLNLLTDPVVGEFDMIFANAVIHHFEPSDLPHALHKMHSALREGGLLAISTKEGHGEMWETEKLELPRYFRLMTETQLRSELVEAGFSPVQTHAGIFGSSGEQWITAIARR